MPFSFKPAMEWLKSWRFFKYLLEMQSKLLLIDGSIPHFRNEETNQINKSVSPANRIKGNNEVLEDPLGMMERGGGWWTEHSMERCGSAAGPTAPISLRQQHLNKPTCSNGRWISNIHKGGQFIRKGISDGDGYGQRGHTSSFLNVCYPFERSKQTTNPFATDGSQSHFARCQVASIAKIMNRLSVLSSLTGSEWIKLISWNCLPETNERKLRNATLSQLEIIDTYFSETRRQKEVRKHWQVNRWWILITTWSCKNYLMFRWCSQLTFYINCIPSYKTGIEFDFIFILENDCQ